MWIQAAQAGMFRVPFHSRGITLAALLKPQSVPVSSMGLLYSSALWDPSVFKYTFVHRLHSPAAMSWKQTSASGSPITYISPFLTRPVLNLHGIGIDTPILCPLVLPTPCSTEGPTISA